MTHPHVPEAQLAETDAGLVPQGEGWFVMNLGDAAAYASDDAGHAHTLEDPQARFPHFGINVRVIHPGERSTMYHAEEAQEAFLVLQGECVLVVEDEERPLGQWDFFHAPPWTAHALIGAGDGPCAVLSVGARNAGHGIVYPVSATAARHAASVERETSSRPEAYTGWQAPTRARRAWPPA